VTDAALVGRLLDEYHERSLPAADICVSAGSEHETRVSYRLSLPAGPSQVIRAFRADAPVPVHARGPGNEIMTDWLLGRALTLACLESARYPAPRPVRTRTGELIGVTGQWLSWATSVVPGIVLRPTLSQLRALGMTLGLLHDVAARPTELGWPGSEAWAGERVGLASRHPAVAVPAALARLDAVDGLVPAAWRPMHAAFRQAVATVRDAVGSVPETLVHGDVWARNAVQPPGGGPVTLIDWETAGLGLAVLDLGNCLLECHLDSAVPDGLPEAWLISPDEDRIAAVADGYVSVRKLSEAELALLPAAITFAPAIVGAVHLELALVSGVSGPAMDSRFARLQNRLAVADDVAALALSHLDAR
jgi:Ser/Thr protein kinase RdoA (MazF antagonist)